MRSTPHVSIPVCNSASGRCSAREVTEERAAVSLGSPTWLTCVRKPGGRLPRGVFDYIDGGAEDEVTMEWKATDFRDIVFVPRVLMGLSVVDTAVRLLSGAFSYPLVLAPTGFTSIAHPDGELAVARAAAVSGNGTDRRRDDCPDQP